VEECDDGNEEEVDGCTNSCTQGFCGDGDVLGDEECDDGNQDDSDSCLSECVLASCGDGFVYDGEEECDDGNTSDLDGCSSICEWEFIIFVTSASMQGDLAFEDCTGTGLEKANCICNELGAGLGGSFAAWLADGMISPVDELPSKVDRRFVTTGGDYVGSWPVFIDSMVPLEVPINRDESNSFVDESVWTNANAQGSVEEEGADCGGWSVNNMGSANIGLSGNQDDEWTDSGTLGCGQEAHLYCFQVAH